ncbi:MAG: hypothetical protein ABI840_11115 [bacterium]
MPGVVISNSSGATITDVDGSSVEVFPVTAGSPASHQLDTVG